MARSVAGKSRERVSASRSESSMEGPSAGGEVNGSLLPDVGICLLLARIFFFSFFT